MAPRTLTPVFSHRDPRAQYYSVAISNEGVVALGRSDGRVRLLDITRSKRPQAPVRLPLSKSFWVTGVAIEGGVVVATSPVSNDAYRVELDSGSVHAIPVQGSLEGVSLREGVVALAASNCVAGRLGAKDLDDVSYCGMPGEGASYAAVALSADGARVAALRVLRKEPRGADRIIRLEVEVFIRDVVAEPPRTPALRHVASVEMSRDRPPTLGWLGERPVLLDLSGAIYFGTDTERVSWPRGFRSDACAVSNEVGLAVDDRGRVLLAHPNGTVARATLELPPPWSELALSPNGQYLAYAAGFAQVCVFDVRLASIPTRAAPRASGRRERKR